jgi:hypothetical protein
MKALERVNIRNDLFDAIMNIQSWNGDLRLKVLMEICDKFKVKEK